jgi:hypothetical protein
MVRSSTGFDSKAEAKSMGVDVIKCKSSGSEVAFLDTSHIIKNGKIVRAIDVQHVGIMGFQLFYGLKNVLSTVGVYRS